MAAQVPFGGLTPVEQSLVDHVIRGDWLDLAADEKAADEAAMRSWGNSRTCRATVIRDILRGRLAADPDPHGLRLRGARISGRIDLEHLTTDVSIELKDCLLEEGILARDARLAAVGLTGCQVEHPSEPPLDAARLTCSVLALDRARIIAHAATGAVNLVGAHVGRLSCSGVTLRNNSGPALLADSLQVDQDMYLFRGFSATGGGELGAVNLAGAHIGGTLSCEGAKLRNDHGPALAADTLQVGLDMYLRDGFTAVGSGEYGAVTLVGVHIGGRFDCGPATLQNDSGPALVADSLQVGRNMYLVAEFAATGSGVALNVTGARVGGTLLFDPARLEHATDSHWRLLADGLAYAGVPELACAGASTLVSAGAWRRLLRYGTPRYAAQPYQQLAAGCRALGYEREVREVLMAQRDDQLARTSPRWRERLWGWITKFTLGYGYQPWRALLFLAGVVALSCVLAVVLGPHGALSQTGNTAAPGRPCTVIQRVSVGLDLNLPVGTSLARPDCGLTRDPAGAAATWLIAAGWVLQILAWTFAALFIAGFTSAVRKT